MTYCFTRGPDGRWHVVAKLAGSEAHAGGYVYSCDSAQRVVGSVEATSVVELARATSNPRPVMCGRCWPPKPTPPEHPR